MSLTVNVGLSQWGLWDLHATGGVGASSPGILHSGEPAVDFPTKRYQGVGIQESDRPLMVRPELNLKVYATNDTKALMSNALRGGGSLPYLKATAGAPQHNAAFDNIKINTFGWSVGEESPLEVDFSFLGLLVTESFNTATTAMPTPNSDVIMGLNLVATINTVDYGMKKASGKVNNKLKLGTHFGTKSSGAKRMPTYIVEGFEENELTIETLMPIGTIDPTADAPSQTNGAVFTFTVPNPIAATPTTIVLTYTNLSFDAPSFRAGFTPDGEVIWKTKFIAKPGSLVIT